MYNKSILYIFFLLFSLSQIALTQSDGLPDPPNPPRLVTDFTLTLNQQEVSSLEQKLRGYADSTSSQIAIVVVKNIGDYEISQYATELALKWKIGEKGKNNGLLILWSTGDRKIYIATGYGFEEKVPDAIAKRIVNQLIIPNFKLGQYYLGLDLATDEIISRMSGQFQAEPEVNYDETASSFIATMFLLGLLLMIIGYIIYKRGGGGPGNRFNDRNRGGWGGGMGGGMPWIITHSGGSGWDGGGGSSGGGGFDFGGFGGGDFGGGGAGGDY
jgi:uncharacterized protein